MSFRDFPEMKTHMANCFQVVSNNTQSFNNTLGILGVQLNLNSLLVKRQIDNRSPTVSEVQINQAGMYLCK